MQLFKYQSTEEMKNTLKTINLRRWLFQSSSRETKDSKREVRYFNVPNLIPDQNSSEISDWIDSKDLANILNVYSLSMPNEKE